MKIVIDNLYFPYDEGCRLLKMKYDTCPMKELEDIWDDIKPMTFKEISTSFTSIEQRRVGIACLGIDNLVKEINPTLIDKKSLKKETTWVTSDGELKKHKFKDTYELYEVDSNEWAGNLSDARFRPQGAVHYIKCKDTSTDREYLIWVDAQEVYKTNDTRESKWYSSGQNYGKQINAIQAIAWTIQTNIEKGDIEKIVRQGDCIMIKKKNGAKTSDVRHLTEEEYRSLLVLES